LIDVHCFSTRWDDRVGQGCYHPIAPSEPLYNAHQNKFVCQVYYPFHPRSGEEIYVVGTRNHHEETCYVIKKADGHKELIPSWMTDPKYENISIVTNPIIQLKAIKKLCWLIMDSKKQFPPAKVKPKTRRKNEETAKSSATHYLGLYSVTDKNTSGNKREIG
jgi:hypothetical protein